MASLRILIVDDHEGFRSGLNSFLASHSDWSVCGEAADGVEAIEQAKALRPDVVLMDISMPRMNGLEATRIIRRDLPKSRVVIVSQNDPAVARRQAFEVNAHECISKTDLSRGLISILKRMLQKGDPETKDNPQSSIDPGQDPQEKLDDRETNGRPGVGQMAALIETRNWAETPLGAMDTWSPRLRMMVDFLLSNRFPLLLWWGPEYISIYNDAYIPVLGKKHPKALGQPVSDCWAEIWPILKPLIDTPFNGGPSTWIEDFELEVRRSGFAEETHFTVAYSPVPDERATKGIGGVLATVHEITEKIISERRVASLAALSARAMEAKTAGGACEIAADVLSDNPKDVPFALIYLINREDRKAELAGTAGIASDLIDSRSFDLDADCGPLDWPLNEVLRTEKSVVVDDLGKRFRSVGSGAWANPPCTALVMPIQSSKAHQLAGVLVIGLSSRLELNNSYRSFLDLVAAQVATSITNARAYEEERKRAEALAEIDRAKTLFFNNVSHEFRTPLTLMLGPIEDMLAKAEGLPAQHREHLEVAHRNSLRLLKLVNTLLDFSRIEAGRAKPQFEQTDLSAFTAELASVFRSAMEKAGLKYMVDCPPLGQPVFIDRDMWEKIVFNLLSNAFKFTPSGEVRVSLSAEDEMAVLSVHDTGSGIPSWELPNIFKRFHRVENTRGRTHEGTGIGLALAQELVKLHDGTTEVESKLGVGTTFRVRVPFGERHLGSQGVSSGSALVSTALRGETFVEEALTWLPKEAQELARKEWKQQEESATPVASIGISRAGVLLAEDNADMRDYLYRLLKPLYEIEAVSNGAAALVAARQNAPDLILSDVMMPEMDGLELVKVLRQDESLRSIPIILLSARAGEEAQVEGMSRGADDYLTKPFSARELLARVATHLQLARIRKESLKALRDSEEELRRSRDNLERMVEQRTTALRQLSAGLLRAQDGERRRVARELHDSVGQYLAAAKMSLESLRRSRATEKEARAFENVENSLDKCVSETRTISHLLHPPLLDELGLGSAMNWYVAEFSKRSGIQVNLDVPNELKRFPDALELVLFRVVQESLTNIHRHSQSRSVDVQMELGAAEVTLQVRDHGKGMPPELLEQFKSGMGGGVGLRSMRERITELGGRLQIQSDRNGTLIRVVVPLTSATANSESAVVKDAGA